MEEQKKEVIVNCKGIELVFAFEHIKNTMLKYYPNKLMSHKEAKYIISRYGVPKEDCLKVLAMMITMKKIKRNDKQELEII